MKFGPILRKIARKTFINSTMTIIKPKMDPTMDVRFCELDSEAFQQNPFPSDCPDDHVTVLDEFKVRDEELLDKEWRSNFPMLYEACRAGYGASDLLHYGFGVSGNSVFCRQGFKVR